MHFYEALLPHDWFMKTSSEQSYSESALTFWYTCLLTDISRLAPIKENLPEYVSYGQIKLTLAILKYEHNVETITAESRYAALHAVYGLYF